IFSVGEVPGQNKSDVSGLAGLDYGMRCERCVLAGLVVRRTSGGVGEPAPRQELIPPFLKLIPPLAMLPSQTVRVIAGLGDDGQGPVVRRIWRIFRGRKMQSDRKSTRLNSSHVSISYAVFCLKK